MAQQHDDSFKLHKFGGMLPAWDDLLLPDGQAASSQNGYLFSGALESWRIPKLLRNTSLSNPGFIYRVPKTTSARASALISLLTNPNAGDTISLGEEIYTFTATVTKAYDVKIGATPAASAINLFAAFTYDNGAGTNAGTLYGTGTVANPAIDQTSPVTKNTLATTSNPYPRVNVVAPDVGAAYNSTLVAESTGGARLAWTFNGNPVTTFLGGANVAINTGITGASVFLEFTDPNTDVVRSPVVDDQYDRFYFASSSVAPQYNTRARIESGLPPWLLGVPAPGCTPGVQVTGGGNTAQVGFPTSTSVNVGAPGANTIYLVPITPPGAMSLNDISFVSADTNATVRYVGVLYDDLNGNPHTRLNTGVVQTGVSAGGTGASAFTNPTGLLSNVQYWIGVAMDAAVRIQFADDTGAKGVVSLNTFSNGPPSIIHNLSTGYADLQIWGDATASSVLEARSYVYTYVTEYGEESPPSPATVLTGWSNGTWTISLFQPPPDQMGVTRDIKKIWLYRTVTATAGQTTYFFVQELDVTTATFADTITDDIVVTRNQLQSQLWSPPPEGLQGLVVMPNGVLAGWKGNEMWFSEPYRPHAWPPSYVQTTEYPIVGLGVSGNACVAATTGAPYVTSGVTPGTMTATKVQISEPCHSRKSIIGNDSGVYYCSPNGLIQVTQYGSVTNTTETWITREKWQALTPQANVVAVFLHGMYFAWEVGPNGNEGTLGNRGFTIEVNGTDAQSFTIFPQPGGHRLGFQKLANALANGLAMVMVDHWSSVVCVISRNGMYYYDFTDQAPQLTVFDWTSKAFQQRTKKNFEAVRIKFKIPPGTAAQNPTRMQNAVNDPIWLQPLPPDRYGYLLVYSYEGILVTAREIRQSQEILRINSGFKHETWQFRFVSRVKIENMQVGTSVKGMANV
jgi:hypothetical protein